MASAEVLTPTGRTKRNQGIDLGSVPPRSAVRQTRGVELRLTVQWRTALGALSRCSALLAGTGGVVGAYGACTSLGPRLESVVGGYFTLVGGLALAPMRQESGDGSRLVIGNRGQVLTARARIYGLAHEAPLVSTPDGPAVQATVRGALQLLKQRLGGLPR